MASFRIRTPDGAERTVPLVKRITSLGRGADNDVRLEDAEAPDAALHVLMQPGGRFEVGSPGPRFEHNGRKSTGGALAHGDVLRVGGCELTFLRDEVAVTPAPPTRPAPAPTPAVGAGGGPSAPDDATSELAGVAAREAALLRQLTQLSAQLAGDYDVDRVLERLMDEAVALTRADKGFLVLLESEERYVKVARTVARGNIPQAEEMLSDSIVERVVRTQKPLVLDDALESEFRQSESVVNLKLVSVMCVPLVHKGSLVGLVYVGNDRLKKRFEPKSLDMLTVFASWASLVIQNALLVNELRLDNAALRKRLEDQRYGDIIGACPGMKDIYRRIDKIAPTDISVLITGETGTGKELIAREIHRRSPRAKGPFVTINCGAIPENLLESELFGHVRGAFTGAVATKAGRFQSASGGTLFLDEIGEMPLQLQVKLLRALQERVVFKVGENRGEPVDIRVVAATNRVLEEEVKANRFREDLFYRLNVVTLRLPPLRERGDDVVLLGRFLLQKFALEFDSRTQGFSPAAVAGLKKYAWPGNIRELENRIKKAVVLSGKPQLGAEDLDLRPEDFRPLLPLAQAREEWEKGYIQQALERNDGNRTKTAKDLGVDPRTVFRYLERQKAERGGEEAEDDGGGGELA